MSKAQNGGNVMERLTYRDKDGFPMMEKRGGFKQGGVERLAAYEETGLTPEEIDMDHEAAEQLRQLCQGCDLDRLEKLAEADKDGRLVVLPCKVGDVVYGFHGEKTILPMVVKWIETCTNGWCIAVQYAQMAPRFYRFSDFGKTVFLTSEEAEKALEAIKDE